jgi:sugar transferase (PEP-CTERM system associated)
MLRVFHHYVSGRKLLLFAAESLAIAVAGIGGAGGLALLMSPPGTSLPLERALLPLAPLSVGLVGTFQFALYALDLYDLRIAGEDRRTGGRILKAAGAAVAVLGLAVFALKLKLPPGALMGGALGAVAGAMAVRTGLRAVVGEPARVFLVGNGVKAQALAKLLRDAGEGDFEVCAMVEPPRGGDPAAGAGAGPAGESIDEAAMRLKADHVVMALDEPRGVQWVDALIRCRLAGMPVHDVAGFCERVLRRLPVAYLRPASLAFAEELGAFSSGGWIKRAFDVVAASLLLLLAAPWVCLAALAIKLDSPGPVFYGQERVGRRGKVYRLWKLRSMRADAERDGAVWAREADERVTRVGRFLRRTRMDEIPQAFNVLRGDMSFVGPRPERPVFVQALKDQIPFYELREAIKPGITGWAQIRYPYAASVEDARHKLEYDLYYVKNGSLFLDLAIIFHTVRHVLLGRGAR